MFGAKSRRIAELEARNALLVGQVADLRETANAWEWAAHRADDLLNQQDMQRRITRTAVQKALAAQQARTARYRAAWQSARQRAALDPAAVQTCRTCGAGYTLGRSCSTCEYRARVTSALTEVTA
jgi:hypothetical protein